MKKLIDILRHKHDIIHEGESMLLEEHALNMAPRINRSFYRNKQIHDLHEADEEILKSIDRLKNEDEIRESGKLTSIIKLCLEPYENRTIHVERESINHKKIVEILNDYKIKSSVVNYKHWLFCPKDKNMWREHSPGSGERLVFYAHPRKRGAQAIEEIAGVIGSLVAKKRKQYTKYHSETYKINDPHGLHARPASEIVKVANQYKDADIWIRTDNKEANAKSIMSMLILEATSDKTVTLLYKPSSKSEAFYSNLESIGYGKGRLLKRV